MINLTATTDKLQLTTSSTSAIDVHVSFVDLSGTTVTPGKQNTAISTATTTDIVAAPAALTQRNVKLITIRNKGSANNDVTLIFDQNGTDYEIVKLTLKPGKTLSYVDDVGFMVDDLKPSDGPFLGRNSVIRTNAKTIDENITFAGDENGMTAGPIEISTGFTVDVTTGSTWTIV